MMEGVPIGIIQRQLGHVSLATTDTYLSHIAPRQVIDAIAKRDWTSGPNMRPVADPVGWINRWDLDFPFGLLEFCQRSESFLC